MCYIQKNIGSMVSSLNVNPLLVAIGFPQTKALDTQIDSVKLNRQSVQGKHCVYFCRKFQKCCHFRFIQHQKLMKKEKIAQKFKVILEDLSSQSQLQMCQLIRKNGRRETKSFLVEKELKMHLKVTYTCMYINVTFKCIFQHSICWNYS